MNIMYDTADKNKNRKRFLFCMFFLYAELSRLHFDLVPIDSHSVQARSLRLPLSKSLNSCGLHEQLGDSIKVRLEKNLYW